MNNSVIIDGVRSPIGLKNGKLIGMRADDLSAQVIKGLLKRNEGFDVKNVDDLVMGCAFPEGSQGMLMAKGVAILSDLPQSVAAKVVNRFCGSSMDAVHQVSQSIISGDSLARLPPEAATSLLKRPSLSFIRVLNKCPGTKC